MAEATDVMNQMKNPSGFSAAGGEKIKSIFQLAQNLSMAHKGNTSDSHKAIVPTPFNSQQQKRQAG